MNERTLLRRVWSMEFIFPQFQQSAGNVTQPQEFTIKIY